jgi:hypothetical protein
MAIVREDIVALDSDGKVRAVAALKLNVDNPRCGVLDPKDLVCRGCNRGKIGVHHPDLAELAAQKQLKPGSWVFLKKLLRCGIERLGHGVASLRTARRITLV